MEEIKKVLQLVEEGKIDAEKASELIQLIKENNTEKSLQTIEVGEELSNESVEIKKEYIDKLFRVKVKSAKGDNVNLKLPIKFVKAIGGAIEKIPGVNVKEYGVDIKLIIDAIDNELEGKLVDVVSAEGDIVEISIE